MFHLKSVFMMGQQQSRGIPISNWFQYEIQEFWLKVVSMKMLNPCNEKQNKNYKRII